jgi:predicted nucleic acid-binding protein
MESYEQTDSVDRYEQKDAFGQVIEIVLHNARSEIVFAGQTTAAITAMLGNKITVANMISNQVATGGSTVCHQVHFTHGRAVNQTARISATYYPLIPGP